MERLKEMEMFNEMEMEIFKEKEMEMKERVESVERLLGYHFKDSAILKQALTEPSHKMMSLGLEAITMGMSKHIIRNSPPHYRRKQLSLLYSLNTSPYTFARIAAKHHLHKYFHRSQNYSLDHQTYPFEIGKGAPAYAGGAMEASKVFVDIIQALAGALHLELTHLLATWKVLEPLFKSSIAIEIPPQQPIPNPLLSGECSEDEEQDDSEDEELDADIQYEEVENNIAMDSVDGKLIA